MMSSVSEKNRVGAGQIASWIFICLFLVIILSLVFLGVGDSLAVSIGLIDAPRTEADVITEQVLGEDPGAQLIDQTENSLTFKLSNGEHRLVTTLGRLFTKDGKEINTKLEKTFGPWVAKTPDALDFAVWFKADGTRRFIPDRENRKEYVEFGTPWYSKDGIWKPLPLGKMHIDDNRIFWESEEYTLEYVVTAEQTKANLIIQNETHNNSLRWKITYNNLAREEDLLVSEPNQKPVSILGNLTWMDSAEKNNTGPSNTGEISYSIEDSYFILEKPDLTGAVYPVTIDPTWSAYVPYWDYDGYDSLATFTPGNTYLLTGESTNGAYDYNTWMQFTGVTIPKGSVITSAVIDMKTTTNSYGDGWTLCALVYAVDEDNHYRPSNHAEWVADHAIHTTAGTYFCATVWDYNNWGYQVSVGAAAIQEIIDRAGWASGNSIGIHIDEALDPVAVGQAWSAHSGPYGAPLMTIGYTVDTTAPTVTSISSDKANGTYTIGEVIDIDVTFSEAVTSTGNVTVTLETGTTDRTCTFTVTNATTGTCNYTVQAGDSSADLDATISGTIKDQALNAMTNYTPGTSLATNKNIVVDTGLPTVTSISSDTANGTYAVGVVIDIDVTFSEAVTSTGNVTVTLETGTTDRTCTFTVTNATTGTCNYTVQAGDISLDLDATISGTIKDQALNAMTNYTPGTSLATNKNIVVGSRRIILIY